MSFTGTDLNGIEECDECSALVQAHATYSHERWHELIDGLLRAEWEREQ